VQSIEDEEAMDITVYLPDEIGERAKKEDLKLSRMLRDAVIAELDRRGAMVETLSTIETYELWPMTNHETGGLYVGRIRGKRLWSDGVREVYLTEDKRVLAHDGPDLYRFDERPEELVGNLADWMGGPGPEFFEVCEALGIRPVIDL
jgi:hypothetical protein